MQCPSLCRSVPVGVMHWDRDAQNPSASTGDTGVQHLPRAGRAKKHCGSGEKLWLQGVAEPGCTT